MYVRFVKESAAEHVKKLRDIVTILENHSITVRMITTDRPGYVVFEDPCSAGTRAVCGYLRLFGPSVIKPRVSGVAQAFLLVQTRPRPHSNRRASIGSI